MNPAALREALRSRAAGRCEYCHLPEWLATLRFQHDHVVARKHRGLTTLDNLAWSCADCNAHKGSDLAGVDPETGQLERLERPSPGPSPTPAKPRLLPSAPVF